MTCAAFDLNKSLLSVNSSFATNGVTLGASTSVGDPEESQTLISQHQAPDPKQTASPTAPAPLSVAMNSSPPQKKPEPGDLFTTKANGVTLAASTFEGFVTSESEPDFLYAAGMSIYPPPLVRMHFLIQNSLCLCACARSTLSRRASGTPPPLLAPTTAQTSRLPPACEDYSQHSFPPPFPPSHDPELDDRRRGR